MGDRSNGTKFNFKVTLTVPDGKTLNSTITGTNNADVVWNEGKTVGTVTFQLSHGESFTLMNLPYDIEYTVDEMNGTTTVLNQGDKINDTYQVSYDNHKAGTIGTGEGKIAPTEGVISTTVTNTWGAEIDTGVILDNAPYILMLAVVAGGAMTLVIKKRREEE